MCLEISKSDQCVDVFVLTGKIGVQEATSIRQQLFPRIQNCVVPITLHLSAVTEMDSAGLGLLMAVQRLAADFNIDVRFTGIHENLKEHIVAVGITL
ncbi:STAS domain-containing protein [Cohnella sp. WQ 127256]|uniref:STAS domain-containing protein n=1 Tax=Cohnella sp. WQ 127256 TaxID=2938790 RepID=UPI002118644A|nr:STAS domain-containing protein [Cohnella sp. WQ 127256]